MGGVRTACGSPHAVWRQIFGQLLQAAGRDIWAPPSWIFGRPPLGGLLSRWVTLLPLSCSQALRMQSSCFTVSSALLIIFNENWIDFGSILGRRSNVLLSILSQRGHLGRARCFRNQNNNCSPFRNLIPKKFSGLPCNGRGGNPRPHFR